MTPEHTPCGWWKDPADGRRYFIPGCMGGAEFGLSRCSCSAAAKRRKVMRHLDLPADYANLCRTLAAVREDNACLRRRVKELKEQVRALRDE